MATHATHAVERPASAQIALQAYINELVHSWCRTLAILAFTLVPIFFILDYFMMPRELLTRFALYRLIVTVVMIGHFVALKKTKPSSYAPFHAYFITFIVGGSIALMTTDLGGFNSTYYAGLNLVLFGTTILLPWELRHAVINCLIIIALYVGLNLAVPQAEPVNSSVAINNLFFLTATAVIAVSVGFVKQMLIKREFWLRTDLKVARDALWGEMEVAKQIQTSLLPKTHDVAGYRIAATMLPAAEVGGDYYDIIETAAGESWLSIGDVSGHGVESGLIMMMTQTSISTTVEKEAGLKPSAVLRVVNSVIRNNISRLGADRYMTLTVAVLSGAEIIFAGKHQDILIYRSRAGTTEVVPTGGTWIGIVDDVGTDTRDGRATVETGDVVLLFSDGLTEATNAKGEMYGQARVEEILTHSAALEPQQIVRALMREVQAHMARQEDDITVVALKRV